MEKILVRILKKLESVCKKSGVKLILIGGLATGLWGRPRATFDIDGLISLKKEKLKDFLFFLNKMGFKYSKVNPLKSIQGLSLLTLSYLKDKIYIDLFIAENEFQKGIIKRAKKVSFQNLNLRIISAEDLILVKLQSGRARDIEDVRDILRENITKLDFGYLKKWSQRLGVKVFLEDEIRSLGLKGSYRQSKT